MNTFITIVAIFATMALLRQHYPAPDLAHHTMGDLPVLRKRFALVHLAVVFLLPTSFVGSLFLAAVLIPHFGIGVIGGVSTLASFLTLNAAYACLYRVKGEEWFADFRAYLNMSYGYDYFKVVRITTLLGLLCGLGFLVYGVLA